MERRQFIRLAGGVAGAGARAAIDKDLADWLSGIWRSTQHCRSPTVLARADVMIE